MRRTDICEAHAVLEWDYNRNGWLPDRPSNYRRKEASAVQLHRMGVTLRADLGGFESLTREGQAIYIANVLKLWLPVTKAQYHEWERHLGSDAVIALCRAHGPLQLQPFLACA